MAVKEIKDMGASVLTRLKKQAKETGINYQTCLQLFAQEGVRGISEMHLSVQTIRICKKTFTKQQSIWKYFSEICF